MKKPPEIHSFDEFRFDAERFALYFKEELLKEVDKKTLQVLAVLLLNPNRLTSHDEIIEKVWADNPHGVTSTHINQYISRLRKVFAKYAPKTKYIETVKGRGYSFKGEVSFIEEISASENKYLSSDDFSINLADFDLEKKDSAETIPAKSYALKTGAAFVFLLLFSLIIFASWKWIYRESDEEKIKRVVKESQLFESLVIYNKPDNFSEEMLDKYWIPEPTQLNNFDRRRIREAVKKMAAENRLYGDESKAEVFEFQSVEIDKTQTFAVVKTLEKWFLAEYSYSGILIKNKNVGPYFVSYFVRKIDGRWLIEKSNTARMIRPTPILTDIVPLEEVKAKQQFSANINGHDFEIHTIHLEIIGNECPENNPCRISNDALRESAKLTDSMIENIPLTLASGDFKIFARNGNSPASNPIYLKIP